MIFPPHPTDFLHLLLREVILTGETVIDATAGNGHDTIFLAHAVGPSGRVIAVDIQKEAVESTAARISKEQLVDRVELHQMSHTSLHEVATESSVAAIVFNLGYLPGADRSVITASDTTVEALTIATSLLKIGGILTVISYPGHTGGASEAKAVDAFFAKLVNFKIAKYEMVAAKTASPFLFAASRIALK